PEGTDARAVGAYDRVNAYRQAVGLPCASFVPEIAAAATAHCGYYTANQGACIASPHREVSGCTKFRAERFGDRMRLAGYQGNPAANGLLLHEVLMYAHAPLAKKTTYRVVIEGKRQGQPLHLEWSFTTR